MPQTSEPCDDCARRAPDVPVYEFRSGPDDIESLCKDCAVAANADGELEELHRLVALASGTSPGQWVAIPRRGQGVELAAFPDLRPDGRRLVSAGVLAAMDAEFVARAHGLAPGLAERTLAVAALHQRVLVDGAWRCSSCSPVIVYPCPTMVSPLTTYAPASQTAAW